MADAFVALGRFAGSVVGDVAPRQVMILVEWQSREARTATKPGR